jgi:hypothetical protein
MNTDQTAEIHLREYEQAAQQCRQYNELVGRMVSTFFAFYGVAIVAIFSTDISEIGHVMLSLLTAIVGFAFSNVIYRINKCHAANAKRGKQIELELGMGLLNEADSIRGQHVPDIPSKMMFARLMLVLSLIAVCYSIYSAVAMSSGVGGAA